MNEQAGPQHEQSVPDMMRRRTNRLLRCDAESKGYRNMARRKYEGLRHKLYVVGMVHLAKIEMREQYVVKMEDDGV